MSAICNLQKSSLSEAFARKIYQILFILFLLLKFPFSFDVAVKKQTKNLPEQYLWKVKGVLYDARGGDSDPQDVLQGGDVWLGRDSVQVAQVAETSTTMCAV